jgi:hypothetical protein
MPLARWETLGALPPVALAPARMLLHHAAQIPAAVGRSLAPARDDDGHTSLAWRDPERDLAGAEVTGGRRWFAALRPGDLSLGIFVEGAEAKRFPLEGRPRAAAFAWLMAEAQDLGSPAESLSPATPYSLPAHAVADGAPFAAPPDGSLAELVRWLANADALVRAVAAEWPDASPVRLWPHHFDVGSVLPLGRGGGQDAASIGIGVSPGDEGIGEPYVYVTPWPPPPPDETLPAVAAGGRWHRQGWTGAVLDGTAIAAAGDGRAQSEHAERFLREVVGALSARQRERS